MKTVFAILCAVVASLLLNYAMYRQKKAVDELPSLKFEFSWSVFRAFVGSKAWLGAVLLSLLGGGMYAVALTMAPVSVTQPIIASGVVLLAYLAIKNLGEKPRRIDYYAIGMSVLGVVLIGLSLAEGLPENVKHDPVELWVFTGSVALFAVVIPLVMRGSDTRVAAGLGISVGLFFGLAAVFGKLLLVDWTGRFPDGGFAVVFSSVFLLAWAASLLPGFILLQAALQRGMAVVVVPILAGLSQLVPILGGMIALNEPLPDSTALAAMRIFAFCLILLGTVILSRRAEEAVPETPAGSSAAATSQEAGA